MGRITDDDGDAPAVLPRREHQDPSNDDSVVSFQSHGNNEALPRHRPSENLEEDPSASLPPMPAAATARKPIPAAESMATEISDLTEDEAFQPKPAEEKAKGEVEDVNNETKAEDHAEEAVPVEENPDSSETNTDSTTVQNEEPKPSQFAESPISEDHDEKGTDDSEEVPVDTASETPAAESTPVPTDDDQLELAQSNQEPESVDPAEASDQHKQEESAGQQDRDQPMKEDEELGGDNMSTVETDQLVEDKDNERKGETTEAQANDPSLEDGSKEEQAEPDAGVPIADSDNDIHEADQGQEEENQEAENAEPPAVSNEPNEVFDESPVSDAVEEPLVDAMDEPKDEVVEEATSEEEKEEASIPSPHEEDEQQGETDEASTASDPVQGVTAAEPSTAEITIFDDSDDDASVPEEKEGIDMGISVLETSHVTSQGPSNGQEADDEKPSKPKRDKEAAQITNAAETTTEQQPDMVENLNSEYQEQDNEEISGTDPSDLVRPSADNANNCAVVPPSVPPSPSRSKTSASDSSGTSGPTAHKVRVRRRKKSGGKESQEGDAENGFDAGTEEQRPTYNGSLYTLHKPGQTHASHSSPSTEDEHTQTLEREETARDEGNHVMIPMPGAFAVNTMPSQADFLAANNDSSDCPSDTESGTSVTEAGETVATAILAEDDEAEREGLERELSRFRRERETAELAVPVATPDSNDDDKSEATEGGISMQSKLACLAVVLLLIGGGVAAYFILGQDPEAPDSISDLPCVTGEIFEDFPLGLCTGDCDTDEECAGDLVCFQREAFEPIPGCACGELQDHRTDYCISVARKSIIETNSLPLGQCEGDCDSDNDCGEGLFCFQRNSNTAVPGCDGGVEDPSKTDYCTKEKYRTGSDGDDTSDSGGGATSPPSRFGECDAGCTADDGCQEGLFCYAHSSESDVPGCAGKIEDSSSNLFCISFDYEVIETNVFPLERCRGDCDVDEDCGDGLFCFQRGSGDAVPGCAKGEDDTSATDYCTLEKYRGIDPLLPLGEYLVGLPNERFGAATSLSGDGTILAVGVPDLGTVGYVNIYKAPDLGIPSSPASSSVIWTQVAALAGEDVEAAFAFGTKVALSADGRTMVVGSVVQPTSTHRAARVQVFESNDMFGGNWTLIEAEDPDGIFFEMTGDEYENDEFDFSVAISSDGNYVGLGQASNGGEDLNVIQRGPLIFRKDQADGYVRMAFVNAPFEHLYSGSSLAFSTSLQGNLRVAAGGDNSVRGDGQVRVRELMMQVDSLTNFTSLVQMPIGNQLQTFGWMEIGMSLGQSDDTSVDLSSDGNFMALSITNRTSTIYNKTDGTKGESVSIVDDEHVQVYQLKQGLDGPFWLQIGNRMETPTSEVSIPRVALSDDGQVLAIGEPWVNFNTGRVRVFKYNQGSNRWNPIQAAITGQTQGELFGSTLSLVGGGPGRGVTLSIGGPFSSSIQVGRGSVQCYQWMESMPESNGNSNQASAPRIQEIAQDFLWSP